MMRPFIVLSPSQVFGCRAAKADEMMPAAYTAIFVVPPERHPQRLRPVVVAGSAHHPGGGEGGSLAPIVGAIGVGPVLARRPLPQIAHHVLNTEWARPGRPATHRPGRIVRPPIPCALGSRRLVAPGIAPAVLASRRLLPFGLRGQALTRPEAVVARAEPGHLDGGMRFVARIGHPAGPLSRPRRAPRHPMNA